MLRLCKVCGNEFEAKGRALYCKDECRRDADAKRKRDMYALETYVKRNLAYYEDGIAEYLVTRGEPRYPTKDDTAGEALIGFVNDDPSRAWSPRSEPTSIGRTQARVRGRDWD